MAKMTAKQKRFCDEYLIDLNATQAAIRAGYSEKYAHTNANKLLQITTIKKYIADRMAEKESQLIASQDEVLQYLTAVLRGEEKDETLTTDASGEVERLEVRKQANQLKAAETLAKYHGLLTDKVEVKGELNNPFAGLTTEELKKLIDDEKS
jgi:phage terminase small subunit